MEEPPPTQDELKEVEASTKTEEGSADGVDASLLEGTGNTVVEEAPPEIFVTVEQMPEFPGGQEALFKYLGSNIKYPQMEKENNIQGTVYLKFFIDETGKPQDVQVARGVKGGKGCDEEAVRVVKSMPTWKAGKQNGKAVRVWYSLPVKFSLK